MEIVRHHFETIDSTNTWAKSNAHALDKQKLTLVTANTQTAGRGRFKRTWESPPNQNIYATFCFFVDKHRTDIGNIPQILAISAAEILIDLGFDPELKWPNDVLLNGKKVAGILCETTLLSENLCLILGIGLNVNMPKEELDKIDRPATSLNAASSKSYVIQDVLQKLVDQFIKNFDKFNDEGFNFFYKHYVDLMKLDSSKKIQFHDNRVVWEGTIASINADGSLNMILNDGNLRRFVSGEILFNVSKNDNNHPSNPI